MAVQIELWTFGRDIHMIFEYTVLCIAHTIATSWSVRARVFLACASTDDFSFTGFKLTKYREREEARAREKKNANNDDGYEEEENEGKAQKTEATIIIIIMNRAYERLNANRTQSKVSQQRLRWNRWKGNVQREKSIRPKTTTAKKLTRSIIEIRDVTCCRRHRCHHRCLSFVLKLYFVFSQHNSLINSIDFSICFFCVFVFFFFFLGLIVRRYVILFFYLPSISAGFWVSFFFFRLFYIFRLGFGLSLLCAVWCCWLYSFYILAEPFVRPLLMSVCTRLYFRQFGFEEHESYTQLSWNSK